MGTETLSSSPYVVRRQNRSTSVSSSTPITFPLRALTMYTVPDDPFVEEGDEEYDRWMEVCTAFFQGLPQAEQQARSAGSHFSTMGDVWRGSAHKIESSRDEWFKPVERSSSQGQRLYQATTLDSILNHPRSQSDAVPRRTKFDFFKITTSEKAYGTYSPMNENATRHTDFSPNPQQGKLLAAPWIVGSFSIE